MKNLVMRFVVALLLVGATVAGFAQGMVYQTHQEMILGAATADGQGESWVQLLNDDYVRVINASFVTTIESTAGWTVDVANTYRPCIAEYNGTIWVAFSQESDQSVSINGTTYPAPPTGISYTILVKLNSSGSVLNSWRAIGAMGLFNIAVKSNNEIALVGNASLQLEHLTSPDGGAVVLIHNGTDWDTSKGFYIEGGIQPLITSVQYLTNGNLALAGYRDGQGNVNFGGINLPPHGGYDGFRGEITPQGVGIQAVQIAGSGSDENHLQITKANGDFMVSGTYSQTLSLYNADGSVGGTLGQFPDDATHDHVYFAYYSAAGLFQSASVVYNEDAGTNLVNIDLAVDDDAFYAMIGNTEGAGIVITPTGSHSGNASVTLKFDSAGVPVWSKQFETVAGSGDAVDLGEEILVNGDIITLCGREGLTADLNFNFGVVSITAMTYIAEYFDGTPPPPSLEVDPLVLNLDAPSGNISFNITSNESWTIEINDPAYIISPSSGSGNASINLSHPSINTMAGVTKTATITSGSNIVRILTINKNGVDPYLTLSDNEETVGADAGTHSIEISCPDDITWIGAEGNFSSPSPLSGTGSGTVVIGYNANTSEDERVDILNFSGNGESSDFTLTQVGAGADLTAVIESNKAHYIVGESPVITVSAAGGTGNYSYSGTVEPGGHTFSGTDFSFPAMEAGHYVASVTVDDGDNSVTESVEFDVHVVAVELVASPQSAHVGEMIDFTATVVSESNYPGIIDEIYIEYGDGDDDSEFSNPSEFSHSYSTSDAFDIEITIFFADGSIFNVTFLGFIEITVGVTTIDDLGMNIYPNPSTGIFNITGKTLEKVVVLDMTGREVSQFVNLGQFAQIDIRELPSGIYILHFMVDDILFNHRVVKQ